MARDAPNPSGKDLEDNTSRALENQGGKGENRPEANKAGAAKDIGACAYRATSVDTKDKKRIVSSKVFQNPVGFIHRQEGITNIPGPA